MLKRLRHPVWLATGIALALSLQTTLAADQADRQDFSQIERGRYLATAADCIACHTLPGQGQKPFAGGRPIETPFGMIVSPNITPDGETGIGAWSDDDFVAALREGKRRDGSLLYPAMPYPYYTKMSREDALAIRAYLNTVAPVRNEVVSNQLPFPLNIRMEMRAWNALFFREGEFKPDPAKSASWNRGAYLVEGPGHCGACHTPKTVLGSDKTAQGLQGGAIQGWFAPNITDDARRGLGRWSLDDIVAYLKTGHNRITAATGPMAEEVALSSSLMSDDDLKAIAIYLKDQAGQADKTPMALAATDPSMIAGSAIYKDVCSACHAGDGGGIPNLIPSLAGSSSVRSDDPASLIRLVLRGGRSVATAAEPNAAAMPAFGWQLDDGQIADVLTYIRNAWGSAAPAVQAADIRKARHDLAIRND